MGILAVPRYLNPEDMERRIGRTVIRYKGKHVYVVPNTTVNDLVIDCHNIFTNETHKLVHSSDEDLDMSAFPLGFVNKEDRAELLTRMPIRVNRQGLCSDNSVYVNRQGHINPFQRGELTSKALFKMLNNEYPDLDSSVKKLLKTDDITSIAVSRKIALERSEVGLINLIYFNNPVAVFDYRSESFKVTERFAHYLPILINHGIKAEVI